MTSVLCSGMMRLNILQLGLYSTFMSEISVMAVKTGTEFVSVYDLLKMVSEISSYLQEFKY